LRAEAANAADVGQALLKSREPAMHATVAAILRAPGIALRFGRFFNDDDNTDANSQHKQQEPHSCLLVALCYKCLPPSFIPGRAGNRTVRVTMLS
jgi:hypothetical protein